MRSAALRELPEGSYVRVDFGYGDGPETVRLRCVREPNERELNYGYSMTRVEIRRFLTGGWIDTWVYPRDVIEVREPAESTLRIIEFIEREVGPKP